MRMAALLFVLTLGLTGVPALAADAIAAPQAAASQPASAQATPQADVDIDVNREGGGAWYTSPTWIAIGVIALVLLVVIIAMASRGSGTTIVRE